MEASVAYLLVGGAPFCDAIGLAQPDVEVAQADYTARLAGLMQQVVRALGVETGEDLAWVLRSSRSGTARGRRAGTPRPPSAWRACGTVRWSQPRAGARPIPRRGRHS